MFMRKEKYTSQGKKVAESLGKQLESDLRLHIRELKAFQNLTKESWDEFQYNVNSLEQISAIALMEERTGNDEGTLWEREQISVQCLLEEAKVNVILRSIINFKAFRDQFHGNPELIQSFANKLNVDITVLKAKMIIYEQSMGLLLKCALNAVEAIQTIDLPALFQYINSVLQTQLKFPEILGKAEGLGIERRQEILAFHYLGSIAANIQRLNEERVFQLIEDNEIVSLVVRCLHLNWQSLTTGGLFGAVQFLSTIVDSEEFQTSKARFLPPAEEEMLLAVHANGLLNKLTENRLHKSGITPILTFLNQLKRKVG